MAETHTDNSSSAGIDLSQFYQVFFEEAGENLDRMEAAAARDRHRSCRRRGTQRHLPLRPLHQGGRGDFRLRRRGRADAPDGDAARQAASPRAARRPRRWSTCCCSPATRLRSQLARHQGAGGDPVLDTSELLVSHPPRFVGGQAPAPTAKAAPAASCRTGRRRGRAGTRHCAPCPSMRRTTCRCTMQGSTRILEHDASGRCRRPVAGRTASIELFKEIEGLGTIDPIDGGHAAGRPAALPHRHHAEQRRRPARPVQLPRLARGGAADGPGAASASTPGYGFFENSPNAPGGSPKPTEVETRASASSTTRPGAPGASAPSDTDARRSARNGGPVGTSAPKCRARQARPKCQGAGRRRWRHRRSACRSRRSTS